MLMRAGTAKVSARKSVAVMPATIRVVLRRMIITTLERWRTPPTTVEILLSHVTYQTLGLQEGSAALLGPHRAACRALEAVLKPFFAEQYGSLLATLQILHHHHEERYSVVNCGHACYCRRRN